MIRCYFSKLRVSNIIFHFSEAAFYQVNGILYPTVFLRERTSGKCVVKANLGQRRFKFDVNTYKKVNYLLHDLIESIFDMLFLDFIRRHLAKFNLMKLRRNYVRNAK